MKLNQIKSLLIVPKSSIDYILDLMNDKNIKISDIKPFEYIFDKDFIYDMSRYLIEKINFNDMKQVSEYIESNDVIMFFSDIDYNLFKKTDIIFINLVNNKHTHIHINLLY